MYVACKAGANKSIRMLLKYQAEVLIKRCQLSCQKVPQVQVDMKVLAVPQ